MPAGQLDRAGVLVLDQSAGMRLVRGSLFGRQFLMEQIGEAALEDVSVRRPRCCVGCYWHRKFGAQRTGGAIYEFAPVALYKLGGLQIIFIGMTGALRSANF